VPKRPQAHVRFKRAHSAALTAEPLCRPIFERWRAEMLAAGTGKPESVWAAMPVKSCPGLLTVPCVRWKRRTSLVCSGAAVSLVLICYALPKGCHFLPRGCSAHASL
jgi:hypothetical protein